MAHTVLRYAVVHGHLQTLGFDLSFNIPDMTLIVRYSIIQTLPMTYPSFYDYPVLLRTFGNAPDERSFRFYNPLRILHRDQSIFIVKQSTALFSKRRSHRLSPLRLQLT